MTMARTSAQLEIELARAKEVRKTGGTLMVRALAQERITYLSGELKLQMEHERRLADERHARVLDSELLSTAKGVK